MDNEPFGSDNMSNRKLASTLASAIILTTPRYLSASPLTTVYSFRGQNGGTYGHSDGFGPIGGLTLLRGTLFGVTAGGGDYLSGTLFRISPDGKNYHIVHHFSGLQISGKVDGAGPQAGLTLVGDTLYGTTSVGGKANLGTVFAFTPDLDAAPRVIYSFLGGNDGSLPMAGVVQASGYLYGTTFQGGSAGCFDHDGCGTVFSINLSTGDETVLHAFAGGSSDGQAPTASLTLYGGALYGTTSAGGGTECFAGEGCGTLFQIIPQPLGYMQIYAFAGGINDGAVPSGGLTVNDGQLFGNTAEGGQGNCGLSGCGTIFAINPKLVNSTTPAVNIVFASFDGASGVSPSGGLLPFLSEATGGSRSVHHGFLGVTGGGGSPDSVHHGSLDKTRLARTASKDVACGKCPCDVERASGTVFQIEPTADNSTQFTISPLYSFSGLRDGALPEGSLVERKGVLFGETFQGGICQSGTIFAVPVPTSNGG